MLNDPSFTIHARDGQARTGTLSTLHGDIRTPAFMPVGTAATVKAMHPEQVVATGADILLGNTYHLMLRPTAERVARLGGLHQFMRWDKPILTDSGGFQVMSLSGLRTITEQAVTFQSHIDGSRHVLSPERSMEIQHLLGSTITMVLDEYTPFPATEDVARSSMDICICAGLGFVFAQAAIKVQVKILMAFFGGFQFVAQGLDLTAETRIIFSLALDLVSQIQVGLGLLVEARLVLDAVVDDHPTRFFVVEHAGLRTGGAQRSNHECDSSCTHD